MADEPREIIAKKIAISDTCRETHGDAVAVNEALRHAREELDQLLSTWPEGAGSEFRITLTLVYEPTPVDESGKT